jgi:hypothetical protein
VGSNALGSTALTHRAGIGTGIAFSAPRKQGERLPDAPGHPHPKSTMRSIAHRSAGLAFALLLLLAATANRAHAQRLGFEAGFAGVENYSGVSPSVGVSVFLPLTERFRGVASYSQWSGCDNSSGCGQPRSGYGNRGFNLVGLYRVAGTRNLNGSLGGGAGSYEMLRVRDAKSQRYYQGALTLSGELRRAVAYNSAVYLRGDMSFPDTDNQPRWGTLKIGVDVGGLF